MAASPASPQPTNSVVAPPPTAAASNSSDPWYKLPANTELLWSTWYKEQEDCFTEFNSFSHAGTATSAEQASGAAVDEASSNARSKTQQPSTTTSNSTAAASSSAAPSSTSAAAAAAPTRSFSQRQMSGQFEEADIQKTWDEDWEDEDPEDTFDVIAGKIARATLTPAQRTVAPSSSSQQPQRTPPL